MGCHGNNGISYNQSSFLGHNFFLYLVVPFNNEMFYVFNVGLITRLDTSLPKMFSHLQIVSLII